MNPVRLRKKYRKKRVNTKIRFRLGLSAAVLLLKNGILNNLRKRKTAPIKSSSFFSQKRVKIPLRIGIFIIVIVIAIFSYHYYRVQASNATYTVSSQAQWQNGEYLSSQIDTTSSAGDIKMASGGPGSWGVTDNIPRLYQYFDHTDVSISNGSDLASDGTYLYSLKGSLTDNFYRFDPEVKKWTRLTDTPVGVAQHGSSITYGGDGYLYAIFGLPSSPEDTPNVRRQFFRYSILNNSWERLTNTPSDYYEGASLAADGGTYIYLVKGDYSNGFYRYEIETNTWSTSLTPPPIEVYRNVEQALSYVPYHATYAPSCTGGCLYLLRGEDSALFYQYVIGTDSWTQMTSVSNAVSYGAALTYDSSNGNIYLSRGGNYHHFSLYDVSANTWDNPTDPTDLPEGKTGWSNGASIEYLGGKVYGLSGGGYDDLYAYDVSGNSWETPRLIATLDSTANDTLTYVPSGAGFMFYAPSGSTSFYRLSLANNSWATKTALPTALADGGALAWTATLSNNIMALAGGNTTKVYKYSISDDTWNNTLPALPENSQWGAMEVMDTTTFVMTGAEGNGFYSRDNSAVFWTTETDTPWAKVSRGADLTTNGTYLYATFGYASNLFYRYDNGDNSWTRLTDLPVAAGSYTSFTLEYDGSANIYALGSPFINRVFKYNIAANTWTEVASYPSSYATYSIASAYDTINGLLYITKNDELSLLKYTPESGTYNDSAIHISDTIDLKYVASWQGFSSTESTPAGTTVTYATRTSANGIDWTSWANVSGGNISSVTGRYIQVRTTMTSTGISTPTVSDYTITYEKDSTAPTNPATFTGYSDSAQGTPIASGNTYSHTNPYISWTAGTDTHSGVAGYYALWSTNSSADPTSSEDYYQTTTYYQVNSNLVAGQTYYLRIATKDNAGNTSSPTSGFTYTYQGASPVETASYTTQADFESVGASSTNLNTAAGGGTNVTLESISGGAWVGTASPSSALTDRVLYGAIAYDSTNRIIYLTQGNNSKKIAKYNILNNSWTATTDITSTNNLDEGEVMLFVPNGNYCADTVGCLFVLVGNNKQEFVRYNINADTWTTLTDAPQVVYHGGSMAWNLGQYIYTATGSSQSFYRFDITNDSWTAMATAPYDMDSGTAFTFVPNGTYCADTNGCVFAIVGQQQRFYRYDIHNDSWTLVAYTGFPANWAALAYNNSGKIYILASGTTSLLSAKLLKYDIATRTFTPLESELWPIAFEYSSANLVFDGDHKLYFSAGDDNYTFLCYDLDAQDILGPNPYHDFNNGYRAAYDGNDAIYRISESSNSLLKKYTISTDNWELIEQVPAALRTGSQVTFVPNGAQCTDTTGCLFVAQGYNNASDSDKIFLRYDINGKKWTKLTDTPQYFSTGASLAWGGGNTIYAVPGNNLQLFYGYSISGNSWSALSATNLPAGQNNGTTLVADGDPNGYIYYLHDNNTDTFMKYDIDGNSWYVNDGAGDPPDTPAALNYSSTASFDGNNKIYAPRANSTGTFYQFNITDDSWNGFVPQALPENTEYPDLIGIDANTMYIFPGTYTHHMLKYVAPSATTAFKVGGKWTSPILDLGTVLAYAGITATYSTATNTEIKIETRSCSNAGCSANANDSHWSSWDEVSNDHVSGSIHVLTVDSGVARYLQMRLWIFSDAKLTATLNDITFNYYIDESEPSNPTATIGYDSNAKNTTFTTDTWYNDSTPYFEWSGATDGEGGSGIAGYYVYFGTNNTKDPYTDASDVTNLAYKSGTNLYANANWDASSQAASSLSTNTYYLKIKTKDNAGNITSTAYAAFTYKYDGTEPNNPEYINADPDVSMTSNFSFTWPAGSDAHSGIASYCYKTGAASGTWFTDQCNNVTTVSSVPAYQGGVNVFYVRSQDNAANKNSSYTEVTYYYSSGAPSAPQNLAVNPSSSTTNSFTFTWNKPATYTDNIKAYHYSVNTEPTANTVSTTTQTQTTNRTLGPDAYATRQGENTFYIVAEDTAGNLSYDNYSSVNFTATTEAPGIPTNVQATDSSDRTAERWQITLTWVEPSATGSGIDHYNIQRSTTNNQNFSTIATTSATGYLDTGLTRNATYYYRVNAEDSAQAASAYSSSVSAVPTGRYTTPPTLLDGPDVNPRILSAKFTWTTDRTCGSFIEFGTTDSYEQEQGQDDNATEHEVIIVGLEPATTYHYRIKSADIDGNILYTDDATFITAGAPSPPTNLTVDPQTSTTNSFTVEWDPPIDEGVVIAGYYFSVNNIPNEENVSYATNEYLRNYALAAQQGINTFYVLAVDDAGNFDFENYASITFEVHTQAPGPPRNLNITDSSDRDAKRYSITLNWDAPGEVAKSEIITYHIWRSTNGIDFTDIAQTQSTSYLDTGLDNTKTYYYKLTAADSAGATSEFTEVVSEIPEGRYTTPPAITGGPTAVAGTYKAVITWETERNTDAHVEFGITNSLGNEQGTAEMTTEHLITIEGLEEKTKYFYRVKIIDIDENENTSAISSFTTQEAPYVSDAGAADVRLYTATINWKTNKKTTTALQYGTSTNYGTTLNDTSGSSTTVHTLGLEGLKDSTVYHFKILGADEEGVAVKSDDYVFTTLTFPEVMNMVSENKAEGQTEIRWQSNVPTTSEVEYYNEKIPAKTQGNTAQVTNHAILLFGLEDATFYKYKVRGRDQFGYEAVSSEHEFRTLSDTTPPQISRVESESNTTGSGEESKVRIIISWQTNEPATSQAEYGAGLTSAEFTATSDVNPELVRDHLLIISNLESAKTYHFRVISQDKAGNETRSDIYSVLTTRQRESFLQLVISNLEKTFSWINNLAAGLTK